MRISMTFLIWDSFFYENFQFLQKLGNSPPPLGARPLIWHIAEAIAVVFKQIFSTKVKNDLIYTRKNIYLDAHNVFCLSIYGFLKYTNLTSKFLRQSRKNPSKSHPSKT